jgi:catabolite regulation protein CreA
MRLKAAFAAAILGWGMAGPAVAEDPDLIFKKTTVWKFLSPDHKLGTYAIDDPDVEGVTCYFTVPEKGGWVGWLGLAEELSNASLSCRQVGPIKFKRKTRQGDEAFSQRRSLIFQRMQIAQRAGVSDLYRQDHRRQPGKLHVERPDQPMGRNDGAGEMLRVDHRLVLGTISVANNS